MIPSAVSLLYPALVEVEEELAAYKARFGDLEDKTLVRHQGAGAGSDVCSKRVAAADGIATEISRAKRRRVE